MTYDPLAHQRPPTPSAPVLLAVDLGLRAGLALYGDDGKLRDFRSQNFASLPTLRRAVPQVLRAYPALRWLYLEGDRNLAAIWEKTAEKRGITCHVVGAEAWRPTLLYPREQRSGGVAKQTADRLARQVIEWSGAPRPTSLNDDVAEAILLGLWAAIQRGLVAPEVARRATR